MKKFLQYIFVFSLLCSVSYAGLITHTDYTAGNVITAAGQNSNENTVFNEFNGNIDNANIKTGGITGTNIAATTITGSKIASNTVAIGNLIAVGAYRRPVMTYVNTTTIDVEVNTSTANTTCIMFPDDYRCVTENTSSTSQFRRMIITETASLSGTWNSGLKSGYATLANTWYALYAVKTTDNSSDFVLVADTVTPTQGNFSGLNTSYGVNGWVYLGEFAYGDASAATTSIANFVQVGNRISFINSVAGSFHPYTGLRYASGAATNETAWTSASGIVVGTSIPSHINTAQWTAGFAAISGSLVTVRDRAAAIFYEQVDCNLGCSMQLVMPVSQGIDMSQGQAGTVAADITLSGFWDGVLGLGSNPQN